MKEEGFARCRDRNERPVGRGVPVCYLKQWATPSSLCNGGFGCYPSRLPRKSTGATRAKQDLKGDAHATTRIHRIDHLNADSRGIRQYSREGR